MSYGEIILQKARQELIYEYKRVFEVTTSDEQEKKENLVEINSKIKEIEDDLESLITINYYKSQENE